MRFIPILGFFFLVILLAILLITKPPEGVDAGAGDKPFPILHVAPLDGAKTWDTKALLGHVTVINFFASWCSPCEAEMPELAAFHKKFPKAQFAGIAWNDEPFTIKTWLVKHGNPFSTLWLDRNGDATMMLGIKGIPETLIVDAKGIVRYRLSGPVTPSLRATTLDPLMKQLLDEAHAQ